MIKFFATLLGIGLAGMIIQRILLFLGLRKIEIDRKQQERISELKAQINEQEKKLNEAVKEYEDAKKDSSDNS